MKHNPNTRNIFTTEGRLNRRIDKHNKRIALIKKMDEAIKQLEEKINSMEPISIDEINKKCYPEYYSETEETDVEECVIRCDGCDHEFDITKSEIERYEKSQKDEDGDICTETFYVCPKCGFSNTIEIDDELEEDFDNMAEKIEDVIEIHDDIKKSITEFNTSIDESNCSDDSLASDDADPNVAINNTSTYKSNKTKAFRFIQDEKVIDAINIAMDHKSVTETISMLKDKNIELITANENNVTGYSTNSGNISFIHDKDNKEDISLFIVNTHLILVPHGNCTKLYNSILYQLGIEKVDNSFESIKLGGKACIIKLHDGSLAACNFKVEGNELTMTIVYDIVE